MSLLYIDLIELKELISNGFWRGSPSSLPYDVLRVHKQRKVSKISLNSKYL